MAPKHERTTSAAAVGRSFAAPRLVPPVSRVGSARPGDPFRRAAARASADLPTAVARLLGMSRAELAATAPGRSLADIAEDRGVEIDGLVTSLLGARREGTQRAVATGLLGRRQADAILDDLDDKMGRRVTETGADGRSVIRLQEPTSRPRDRREDDLPPAA